MNVASLPRFLQLSASAEHRETPIIPASEAFLTGKRGRYHWAAGALPRESKITVDARYALLRAYHRFGPVDIGYPLSRGYFLGGELSRSKMLQAG